MLITEITAANIAQLFQLTKQTTSFGTKKLGFMPEKIRLWYEMHLSRYETLRQHVYRYLILLDCF